MLLVEFSGGAQEVGTFDSNILFACKLWLQAVQLFQFTFGMQIYPHIKVWNLCKYIFFTHSLDLSGSEGTTSWLPGNNVFKRQRNTMQKLFFFRENGNTYIVLATRLGKINGYFVCCSFLSLCNIYSFNPFRDLDKKNDKRKGLSYFILKEFFVIFHTLIFCRKRRRKIRKKPLI